ncbi:MAG: hypothetical protein PVJ67_00220 [Candidatus Pacearchaeota archaeon]|jgi:hypothetical protein
MESVFDVVSDGMEIFLRTLEDELKGTLHCIAHAGKNKDKRYIASSRRYYERKYGEIMNELTTPLNWTGISPIDSLGIPGEFISNAYYNFIELGKDLKHKTSEELREEAENILGEYLEIPDPNDFDNETRNEILKSWGWTDKMIEMFREN